MLTHNVHQCHPTHVSHLQPFLELSKRHFLQCTLAFLPHVFPFQFDNLRAQPVLQCPKVTFDLSHFRWGTCLQLLQQLQPFRVLGETLNAHRIILSNVREASQFSHLRHTCSHEPFHTLHALGLPPTQISPNIHSCSGVIINHLHGLDSNPPVIHSLLGMHYAVPIVFTPFGYTNHTVATTRIQP